MPELPEVQTVVDSLNQCHLAGRIITGARVFWPKTVAPLKPAEFCRSIRGCRIERIGRRGKYIVCGLSERLTLLIHLRMTGRLNWVDPKDPRNPHEHVILKMDTDGELRFQDTRKFGRLILTDTPDRILGRLGPEPLPPQFTGQRLACMLAARKRQIKPLLLDQTFVAGLGNIYVDEALWQARIHPLRQSDSLNDRETASLHRAIRRVLNQGLRNRGTSLGGGKGNFTAAGRGPGRNADQLKVFRRTGSACPRCRTIIMRILVGQRSSHICPRCQEAPV